MLITNVKQLVSELQRQGEAKRGTGLHERESRMDEHPIPSHARMVFGVLLDSREDRYAVQTDRPGMIMRSWPNGWMDLGRKDFPRPLPLATWCHFHNTGVGS